MWDFVVRIGVLEASLNRVMDLSGKYKSTNLVVVAGHTLTQGCQMSMLRQIARARKEVRLFLISNSAPVLEYISWVVAVWVVDALSEKE
jgi:hypothetical protein